MVIFVRGSILLEKLLKIFKVKEINNHEIKGEIMTG